VNRTTPRQPWQNALLIAVDDKLATECTRILKALTLDVVPTAGALDAIERIVTLQPALVVAATAVRAKSGDALLERAEAAGAEIVWVEKGMDRIELMELLASAASRASARAERGER
jgi:hypothetical protein